MDENIVYFQNILPQLKSIYLHEVWEKILRMIARRIHSTGLYPSDWKDFAAEIGINDSLVLEDIEISATVNKELPLCVAFCGPLQYSYTLHDIIQALINLRRADVLCLIREEFEDFWNEQCEKMLQHSARASSHSNCAVTCSPQNNPSLTDEDAYAGDLASRSEIQTYSCDSEEVHCARSLDCSRSEEQKGDELTTKMESKDHSKTEESSPFEILCTLDHNTKLSDVHFIHCKPLKKGFTSDSETLLKVDIAAVLKDEKPRLEDDKAKPVRSPEPICVFVIYVSCEIRTGIRLAEKLRQFGLKVITLNEAEFMIRCNRSSFLKTLLEKVDFIIPIICEEYMLCVRSDRIRKLNSSDKKTNRFIFTWIHTEYENNDCFNFRVKPVVVEKFDWNLIGNDPIFQWVHQLWTEVADLVQILRDTKRMMRNIMDLWSKEEFVEKWMNFLNPT